jgi:hypothetical protein
MVEVEIDDDIAAEMSEQRQANERELQRVVASIAALPDDQQQAAWDTFHALVRDRTDRAMARCIARARSDSNMELAAALQASWDQIKSERTTLTATARPH